MMIFQALLLFCVLASAIGGEIIGTSPSALRGSKLSENTAVDEEPLNPGPRKLGAQTTARYRKRKLKEHIWPVYTWQWTNTYYCLEGGSNLSESDFPEVVFPEDAGEGDCFGDCTSSEDDKIKLQGSVDDDPCSVRYFSNDRCSQIVTSFTDADNRNSFTIYKCI